MIFEAVRSYDIVLGVVWPGRHPDLFTPLHSVGVPGQVKSSMDCWLTGDISYPWYRCGGYA